MHGEGGTIEYEGVVIGSLGTWKIRAGADEGSFTLVADGCRVNRYWLSAGIASGRARPRDPKHPHWEIVLDGAFTELTATHVLMTNLRAIEQGAD